MMSEYSIQFWVMIGTLVTAGGTLLLGLGVLLAWFQLKHSKEALRNQQELQALGDYMSAIQDIGVRAQSGRFSETGGDELARTSQLFQLVFGITDASHVAQCAQINWRIAQMVIVIKRGGNYPDLGIDTSEASKALSAVAILLTSALSELRNNGSTIENFVLQSKNIISREIESNGAYESWEEVVKRVRS